MALLTAVFSVPSGKKKKKKIKKIARTKPFRISKLPFEGLLL